LARFGLITGVCAFGLAFVLVVANHHTFINWLLLGGTFGNLVATREFTLRSRLRTGVSQRQL
jgi:hypothetical protein